MTKIVFIADVFAEQWLGGGELNNQELIQLLKDRGCEMFSVKSESVKMDFLQNLQDDVKIIISNFIQLTEDCKTYIKENCQYIIYEHDHKYLKSRDPSVFENYTAPDEEIINLEFYKNAKAVVCQSKLHADVVEKNIKTGNVISVGGNLWSLEVLDLLSSLGKKEKKDLYSIWNSYNPIKNTPLAKAYCIRKNLEYDLIDEMPYEDFLNRLTDNKYFIFLPQTLETLCRVVVECRMTGMTVLTNSKLGATSEDWFSLKGEELIDIMRKKREEIPSLVLEVLE
jgi:hypothetical protein